MLDADVDYTISEDPVEAMSLLTAGIVTGSELTVQRAPIDFLEIELAVLAEMGLRYELSPEYLAANGHTRLADITISPSVLQAPIDKIHPMPFPGLNIDNLPFFAVIAAQAEGATMIHDWVYDNRAIHLSDLTRLGADVRLLDPHRVLVNGPDPLVERRGGLPARAAAGGLHPAGDARGQGHVGAAQRRHHRPRLRAPLRAPGRDGRAHRGLPRLNPGASTAIGTSRSGASGRGRQVRTWPARMTTRGGAWRASRSTVRVASCTSRSAGPPSRRP